MLCAVNINWMKMRKARLFLKKTGFLIGEAYRKIFVVREEIKNTGYNKYRSSTIANGVCDKTVAYMEEEMGNVIKGVEIASETVRYYPNKNLASHILGYMGSISDSQYEEYVKNRGYSADNLIGKDGIEAVSMESTLRGTDGVKSILVNSAGDYMETLEETEPVAGKDIYLTIDADLQKEYRKDAEKCNQGSADRRRIQGKIRNSPDDEKSKLRFWRNRCD